MAEKTFLQVMCLSLGIILMAVELIVGLFVGLTYLNLDVEIVNILSWMMLIFGLNVLLVTMIYVGLRKE